MKFLCILLASLFGAADAQYCIRLPKVDDTIEPGSNITVQLIVPYDTSPAAGLAEISLAIGIVNCGTEACPNASKDLGKIVYLGKYQHKGTDPINSLNGFANFTIPVPPDITGQASIQVQHIYFLTPPGHSLLEVECTSCQVNAGLIGSDGLVTSAPAVNIHPNGNNNKCMGILGGLYRNGSSVDIYDCDGTASQKWQWNNGSLQSTNPADGSTWCLDAGLRSTWKDGVQMKIWNCCPDLEQQTWMPVTTSGTIQLTSNNFCLDLTGGKETKRNILQMWTCINGCENQLWDVNLAS